MADIDFAGLYRTITANNKLLTECPKHYFVASPPIQLGQKVICANCGGAMNLVEARQYILGYMAGGGDPNDVWPGWN